MKRFKNILVVYGSAPGAEDALTQATVLARANRAKLTLIDTLQPLTVTPALIKERRKRLECAVSHLKLDGVAQASCDILIGTESEEIITQVLRDKHDIVIASCEGGNIIHNTLYGNTAIQLIRNCPCPVWLLKPDHSLQRGRLLAAIDPDPERPDCIPLNTKIMDLAASLSASYGAGLHVLHAWDVTGNDKDTLTSEVPDATREKLLDKHLTLHRERVEDLLSGYRLKRDGHKIHLPRDIPENAILNTVREEKIDLVVLGASAGAGFLSGHAAETILDAVRGGVLTVRPAVAAKEQPAEILEVA